MGYLVGSLTLVVVAVRPPWVVRVRVHLQAIDARLIEVFRIDPAHDPLVLVAAARVRSVALLPGPVVADVGVQIPAAVDALGEVPLPLEVSRDAATAFIDRILARLPLLAPEEEELRLVLVEDARDVDGTADRVAEVVPGTLGRLDERAAPDGRSPRRSLVGPAVGVPTGTPAVPVARTVEGLRAALGDHLDLRTHRTAVLRLVGVREHLELRDGVDVGRDHVAAVVAGVEVGDAVDRHVVRGRPLPVRRDTRQLRGVVGVLILSDARHEGREVEEGAAVVGDVGERLTLQRVRALAARRLQLADARGDGDALRERADLQRHGTGGQLVVRVDHQVGLLRRLEALHADLERVGVRPHEREDEVARAVDRGGQHVALRAARQRHGRARQDPSLRVLDRARH